MNPAINLILDFFQLFPFEYEKLVVMSTLL